MTDFSGLQVLHKILVVDDEEEVRKTIRLQISADLEPASATNAPTLQMSSLL